MTLAGFAPYSCFMTDPVVLVILCLAVAGMTRALVIEKPFAWWRNWVKSWSGEDGLATYLVHCVFCTGFWVGAVNTGLLWFLHQLPHYNPAQSTWLAFLTVWAIFAVAPHIADR